MKYSEIRRKSQVIATKPFRKVKQDKLNAILNEYKRKTPTSQTLFERAKHVIPNGSQHTHPETVPYPLFMKSGSGSRIYDVDGNKFLDYVLAGGALILGHNHEYLNERVTELIKNKTNFHGFYDEYEIKAAEKIIELFPSIEEVRFTASGNEANLAAVRIARSFTGNRKIIKFRSNYHGWADQFLTDIEIPGSNRFLSHGIPTEFLDQTILIFQNDLQQLEDALKSNIDKGGTAAIICEPYGGDSGLVPFEEDFHKNAINLAHKYGALYIFDEVVTGFSAGIGGAQKLLGVDPDITTLGKGLMGGYPSCGACCGKKEIIDTANTKVPTKFPFAYIVGTLSANVLSTAACYYTLSTLEKKDGLNQAIKTAEDLCAKMNTLFSAYDSDFFTYNYGAIMRTELTAPHATPLTDNEQLLEKIERRAVLSKYVLVLNNEGILSRMGRDFVSCVHTEQDNDSYVAAYEKLLNVLES